MGIGCEDKVVRLDVPCTLYSVLDEETMRSRGVPMDEPLRMTPVNCADNLRRPPSQIILRNLSVVRTRFQKIPKSATLSVVHDQI